MPGTLPCALFFLSSTPNHFYLDFVSSATYDKVVFAADKVSGGVMKPSILFGYLGAKLSARVEILRPAGLETSYFGLIEIQCLEISRGCSLSQNRKAAAKTSPSSRPGATHILRSGSS